MDEDLAPSLADPSLGLEPALGGRRTLAYPFPMPDALEQEICDHVAASVLQDGIPFDGAATDVLEFIALGEFVSVPGAETEQAIARMIAPGTLDEAAIEQYRRALAEAIVQPAVLVRTLRFLTYVDADHQLVPASEIADRLARIVHGVEPPRKWARFWPRP